ncbi:MAG: hypothetical protein M0Q92_05590 [Methanoregula sp.]|nr:hypothetical protein [Methanoregula sp.]
MRPPHIPPMLTDIVQTAVSTYDGMEFTHLAACPFCGSPVQGYDTRQKKYAVLKDRERERTITVRVKRFTCRSCNKLCNADEPFYPDSRIGSLVVDLYFSFATTMPGCRAARLLGAMGIKVDRTTWKNYAGRRMPEIPATEIFGMRLPTSVLAISDLKARSPRGEGVTGADALAACGFPSTYQAVTDAAPAGGRRATRKPKRKTAGPISTEMQSDSMSRQAESS